MFTIARCLVVGLALRLLYGWQVVMHTYLCDFRMQLSWATLTLILNPKPYPAIEWRQNKFENGGAPIQRKAPEKLFWVMPLHFLALKAQIVVLVSAFMMVSTVWSVSCLLLLLMVPPVPSNLLMWGGGTCPRAPWSRRHCQLYSMGAVTCTSTPAPIRR